MDLFTYNPATARQAPAPEVWYCVGCSGKGRVKKWKDSDSAFHPSINFECPHGKGVGHYPQG